MTDPKALTNEEIDLLFEQHADVERTGDISFWRVDGGTLDREGVRDFARALATREQTASTGEPVGEVVGFNKVGFGSIPIVSWDRPPTIGDKLYAAPVEQAGSTLDETLRAAADKLLRDWDAGGWRELKKFAESIGDFRAAVVREQLDLVAQAPDETLREALAGMLSFFGGDHPGPDTYAGCDGCKVCEAARRALATPTKPEMQSVHPAVLPSKEKP